MGHQQVCAAIKQGRFPPKLYIAFLAESDIGLLVGAKILFVDDESDLRLMVASYFELFGYNTLTAGDVEEAQRLSTGVSLGAIILDATLPDAGSLQLVDFLKRNHPATPIILYTGRQPDDEIVRGLLARGAQSYLHKDGSLQGLLAAVKAACG